MADNKKYMKNLICALFVMAVAFAIFPVSVCAEEEDWVEIVSVIPNSFDNYTDSVTFTATINYSLQSAEQGIVYLGFNTSQPNYYEIEEEPGTAGQVVSRGTGTVVLSKEVTPVNWDTAISRMQQYMQGTSYPVTDFKIYANISEYPHDIPWTPLAIYEAVLTDIPETEASANELGQGYSDGQLCDMARQYYQYIYSGAVPEFVMVDHVEGDTVVIHLYDIVDGHTATYDWYNVDRYTAKGTNLLGEAIDLTIYGESEAGIAQPKAEYKVYCGEGFPDGYEVFDCSLEECLLNTNSSAYNPQLAHMLIAMCNSVYDGTDIGETFNSFGFQNLTTSYTTTGGIMLAYGMAKKQIGSVGNEKTLVLVVARGTEEIYKDPLEWASNIHVAANDKNQHTGFADAANALYDRMVSFLGTSDFSNVQFVITGFSRGAASANILAGRLVDEGVGQSRIYAYTFACPDTAKVTDDTAGKYQCIFNIADAKDFVSWVPGTLLGDEWNKYGQSYWYCDEWNDYQNLEMGMDAHNQAKYLEYLRSENPESEYRQRSQTKAALDNAATRRDMDALQRALDSLHKLGYRNTRVVYTGVYCPVDLEIRTSDGRLAGSVVDDVAEIILADKVYLSVDGSRKHIYFLDEDTYSLQLTATDDGSMYYTVQSIDVETQETTEKKVFPAVVLTDGRQMTSSVTVGEDGDVHTGEVKLFVLGDGGVNIAEIQENGEEIPMPEMQGTDGAKSVAGEGEMYTEKDTERDLSTEEKSTEDKPNPYTTGILNIIVIVAVTAMFILMGAVIILRVLAKRRKYADAIRPLQEKPCFCPVCGKRAGSNAAFCRYCGTKIP